MRTGIKQLLNIINIMGQELRTFEVKSLEQTINISELPAGNYFFTLSDGNQRQVKKFIKIN